MVTERTEAGSFIELASVCQRDAKTALLRAARAALRIAAAAAGCAALVLLGYSGAEMSASMIDLRAIAVLCVLALSMHRIGRYLLSRSSDCAPWRSRLCIANGIALFCHLIFTLAFCISASAAPAKFAGFFIASVIAVWICILVHRILGPLEEYL